MRAAVLAENDSADVRAMDYGYDLRSRALCPFARLNKAITTLTS
jgi:hypothetical protein